MSNDIDIKPKAVRRNKGSHFILIEGTIHQEDITIPNIYSSSIQYLIFIKQILLDINVQIYLNTIAVYNFNIQPSPRHNLQRQKTEKKRNIRIKGHYSSEGLTIVWGSFIQTVQNRNISKQPMKLSLKQIPFEDW